jgi:TonB dependent receptor
LCNLFSEKFSIFVRYNDSPSRSESRTQTNLAQTLANEFRTRSATAGATYFINSRLTNDFRFNYTRSKSNSVYQSTDFGGAAPFTLNDVPGLGSSQYNRFVVSFLYGDLRPLPAFSLLDQTAGQNQFNIVNTMNASFGVHTFKFGFDYRRTSNYLYFPPLYMPVNIANQGELINNNIASMFLVTYSLEKLQPIYQNFSAFVQDEWKLSSRLNLSLGLRYEVNPPPGDAGRQLPYTVDQIDDLTTTKLAAQNTPLWKTTYNNFAPRVGAAYRLGQRSGYETVLRGGFGIFYDLGNTQASDGYGRAGFRVTNPFTGAFPLTQAQIDSAPGPSLTAPYTEAVLTDDPNLKLPYTAQWNFAIEQTLGADQTLSLSYVGSAGRRLLIDRAYSPSVLGNPNFGRAGMVLTQNLGDSDYHALQTRFQRRLARGLQALAAYTWSHSLDNATSNFTVRYLLRGNSDFDIRHNFQTALSYDIPGRYNNGLISALLKSWAIDGRFSARSSLPVNVIGSTGNDTVLGFVQVDFQPNLVPGQPLYLDDPSAPGGRRFNPDAFDPAPEGQQGDFGRNILRGFNAIQTDLALRREFPLGERLKLQFRAESFNIFNRANFGAIYNQVTNVLFGLAGSTQNTQLGGLNSLYQVGGPRSFQFALKFLF